ncbi:hypothetical protein [Halovibrio sp. HP20-50]|uniref:hypothetical protein n=1 Tax=Halovibrio sp. HP20-59 TaxID=3080275 RepID=UPI00294B2B3A|nr:hypothetical protein [Halovibrio sp. HP20-59]MEA2120496.1 hypothetical protein [Halovibrio sp. HP20-59]
MTTSSPFLTVRQFINASILEHFYFLRFEVENHFALVEVYVTQPTETTAQRLINRKGYRSTLLEKVELAVAVDAPYPLAMKATSRK